MATLGKFLSSEREGWCLLPLANSDSVPPFWKGSEAVIFMGQRNGTMRYDTSVVHWSLVIEFPWLSSLDEWLACFL